MTGPDLSHLAPQDAVAAFRSYPRRYAAELEGFVGDDDPDEVAARIGPDGLSANQIVSDVCRTWAVIGGALEQVLRRDDAVLHPAISDPAQRQWDPPPPDAVADGLQLLGHEAEALADQVEGVHNAGDWSRSAAVAGGGSVSALELVKDAVGVGADGLARVRATLAAVRR
jgi:hypothetical protein